MKNKLMLLAALAALVLVPAASALAGDFYVTPKLGYSSLKAKSSGSITDGTDTVSLDASKSNGQAFFGVAFGYDFKESFIDLPVRAELEYAYRGKKEMFKRDGVGTGGQYSDKLEVGVQSFFVNAYYDFENSSPVTPYIGLGAGLAVISANLSGKYYGVGGGGGTEIKTESENGAAFAWNIGAGAAWKITEPISLDLGYRYADFGKVDFSASGNGARLSGDVKANAHEVMLGLRFSF